MHKMFFEWTCTVIQWDSISTCSLLGEHSGLVIEYLTQDRGVAGSSMSGGTALCHWARHFILCLVLEPSWHGWKIAESVLTVKFYDTKGRHKVIPLRLSIWASISLHCVRSIYLYNNYIWHTRNPKFGVWIHLECRILFLVHSDLGFGLSFRKILSRAYLLYYLR